MNVLIASGDVVVVSIPTSEFTYRTDINTEIKVYLPPPRYTHSNDK
jgi:hypothetical protein